MAGSAHTPLSLLAESQWGVISRSQLLELGFGPKTIDARVHRGALRRVHRGVYAFGHAQLRDEGRWRAALLACGDDAVLSHASAAQVWGLRLPRLPSAVHVTAGGHRRGDEGLVVHRSRSLTGADVTTWRGFRVTTVARTFVDLADDLGYEGLRSMADHGVRLDEGALRRAHERAPARRGARAIVRLLGSEVRTRSALERQLRRLCRAAGVELPLFNVRVLGMECDAVWRRQRLVVEVDGHAVHAAKGAREVDYRRDAALVVAGWRVVRFSYDQVFHEPDAVIARLRALLA